MKLDRYQASTPGSVLHLGTAESQGNERLHITLSDGWQGLSVRAVFLPCKVSQMVPEGGIVSVPWEATKEPLTETKGRVVFRGLSEDGRVMNSLDLHYTVEGHSPTRDREENKYTPGAVDQIIAETKADAEAADRSAQAAAASASSAAASQGAAAQSAATAAEKASQAASSEAAPMRKRRSAVRPKRRSLRPPPRLPRLRPATALRRPRRLRKAQRQPCSRLARRWNRSCKPPKTAASLMARRGLKANKVPPDLKDRKESRARLGRRESTATLCLRHFPSIRPMGPSA